MAIDKETARYILELTNELDRLWRVVGYDREAKEARRRGRDIEGRVAGYKKDFEETFKRQYEERAVTSTPYWRLVMPGILLRGRSRGLVLMIGTLHSSGSWA